MSHEWRRLVRCVGLVVLVCAAGPVRGGCRDPHPSLPPGGWSRADREVQSCLAAGPGELPGSAEEVEREAALRTCVGEFRVYQGACRDGLVPVEFARVAGSVGLPPCGELRRRPRSVEEVRAWCRASIGR